MTSPSSPTAAVTAPPFPAPDPAVRTRGLRVHRGRREVLHGLDLEIPAGRITGLLGPSGCGKTTLMRAIVGVESRVSGELTVLGMRAGATPLRRRIGYVAQAASVYGDLSVTENLRFFASVLGVGRSAITRALDAVDLTDRGGQVVSNMSGGQRSRVSLAVALLGDPELLVLDEPTVGLDPVLRISLWELFAAQAAQGCTVLVSSHVMDEAEHCDRLLLMREGDLLADETPARLKERTGAPDIEAAFLEIVR